LDRSLGPLLELQIRFQLWFFKVENSGLSTLDTNTGAH
jgi:hypothetical protein